MGSVRSRRTGVAPVSNFSEFFLGGDRRDACPTSTTFASSASSTGALSPMGEAVTRLPPIVARLRICREPNTRSMSPSAGNSSAILSSISVSVTAAPMCHSVPVDLISFNSGTASTEISAGNFV